MKRIVTLGLAALFFCLLLIPGCAQRATTADPSEKPAVLAGGASNSGQVQTDSPPAQDFGQAQGDPQAPTDGDGQNDGDSPAADGGADAPADGGAEPVELAQQRTQQYGTRTNYTELDGSLNLRFNHPSGDIPALDQAVVDWMIQTGTDFKAGLPEGSTATLAANYDSYEVNGRVVGVLVTGSLSYSHDVAPQAFLGTFNADRTTGQLITLDSLLREGGEAALRQMAGERAGTDPNRADLLSNWLLSDTGLRLYLDGALAVEIPYSDLLGVLDLPQPERVIDPSKPMIALTFDDGPSKNTTHILDLLRFYNSRATFFVVGNRVSTYASTAQRAAADGNEIGNHTWEHAKLTALTPEQIAEQLTLTTQAVQQYTGATCAAVRPTGGACNDTVKTVAGQLGYILVNWSVDTEDWKTRDADATYNAVMAGAQDGAIVLCHDLYESTAAAMDRVIPELIAQGYQLVTVSELLSYREGGAVPGTLYTHR